MLCFLDDLAGTWYGLVIYFGMGYWVLSITLRSFDGCCSCAHLWFVHYYYTASAIIQLVREQMVIVPFVNYDGAPVGLRRRGREVS